MSAAPTCADMADPEALPHHDRYRGPDPAEIRAILFPQRPLAYATLMTIQNLNLRFQLRLGAVLALAVVLWLAVGLGFVWVGRMLVP
jgi:hypothetical protein